MAVFRVAPFKSRVAPGPWSNCKPPTVCKVNVRREVIDRVRDGLGHEKGRIGRKRGREGGR